VEEEIKYIVSHVRQCHGVHGVEKIDHILTSSKKLVLHQSQILLENNINHILKSYLIA